MVILHGIDASFASIGPQDGQRERIFLGVVLQPQSAVAGEAVGGAFEFDFVLVPDINLEAHGAVVAGVVKEVKIWDLQDEFHACGFDGVGPLE